MKKKYVYLVKDGSIVVCACSSQIKAGRARAFWEDAWCKPDEMDILKMEIDPPVWGWQED